MKIKRYWPMLLLLGALAGLSGCDPVSQGCPTGLTDCDGTCVNMQSDQLNCGACGNACEAGFVCNGAGSCELSCQAGLTDCSGTCVDTASDLANCGTCGNACNAGEVCNGSGSCEVSCQAGLLDCNGTCIDPDSDRTYCGATADCQGANAGAACAAGEICDGTGQCALSCQSGLLDCNGTCINPDSDHTYCGATTDCQGANAGTTCAADEACSLGSCTSLQGLNVAVMGGSFYTDNLRAFLETQPGIESAVQNTDCSVAALSQFDVVILYGNMACFDATNFDTYVQNGGGLIGTPWIHNNNFGLPSLPVVMGAQVNAHYGVPLNVTVTDATDPLLDGVTFNTTDSVGWEEIEFTLQTGATSSVLWQNNPAYPAVAKWDFGAGRAVYLNFHYITSDSSPAGGLPWAQQLAYNSVLWAGHRK